MPLVEERRMIRADGVREGEYVYYPPSDWWVLVRRAVHDGQGIRLECLAPDGREFMTRANAWTLLRVAREEMD